MIAASVNDVREMARRRLTRFLFVCRGCGSNAEVTFRGKISDLEDVALRLRVPNDVFDINLTTELFGQKLALPVALAPIVLDGLPGCKVEIWR